MMTIVEEARCTSPFTELHANPRLMTIIMMTMLDAG